MSVINSIFCLLIVLACSSLVSARFHCHNNCGGKTRGYCNYDQTCVCNKGYSGFDCSQKDCPYDFAWADKAYSVDTAHSLAECSRNGICNRQTGYCQCFAGFEGAACQKVTCGGCSGRGECKTIGEIYLYKQMNAGVTPPLIEYTPWEQNHITACVCDFGYSGPNCEYKLCPRGDDPVTETTGYPTIEIAIDMPEGTDDVTGWMLFNYLGFSFQIRPQEIWNETQCNNSFLSLPNVAEVNCTILDSTDIRRVYSVQFIEFARLPYENNIFFQDGAMSNFNADPPANPFNCDTSLLNGTHADSITCDISLVHSNFTYPEYTFCSNRGTCDFTLGVCTCFIDFTNSDCSDYSVGYQNYTRYIATDVLQLESTDEKFVETLVDIDTVSEGLTYFNAIACKDSDSTIFAINGYGDMVMNYGGMTVVGTLDTGGASIGVAGLSITGGMTVNNLGMTVASDSDSTFDDGVVVKVSGLQITGGATVVSEGLFAVDGATVDATGMRIDKGLMTFAGGATVTLGGLAATGGMSVAGGGILINKHGASVRSGGLYVYSGGITMNGINSGLEMPDGMTIAAGGLWVTGGSTLQNTGIFGATAAVGMSIGTRGMVMSSGGITIRSRGLSVTGGLTIADGVRVTNGITVNSDGIVASGGVFATVGGTVTSDGAFVEGGAEMYNGIVVRGGLTLVNGFHRIAGTTTAYVGTSGLAVTGGISIHDGLRITGGMSILDGFVLTTGGLTVSNTGLYVDQLTSIAPLMNVAGGMTISTAGIRVLTLGMTISNNGLVVTGASTIGGGKLSVSGGLTVRDSGASLNSLTIQTFGLRVSNGLSIAYGGLLVSSALSIKSGGLTSEFGLAVTAAPMVVAGGVTLNSDGITIVNGLSMSTNGLFITGGSTINRATVVGGMTVRDLGILSEGPMYVYGGMSATDVIKSDVVAVVTSGLTIKSVGLRVTKGLTIVIDGLRVSGGASIEDSGISFAAGSVTVNSHGVVASGGVTVSSLGAFVSGGMTVSNGDPGSRIVGGLSVKTGGVRANSGIVGDGVVVSSGMTIRGGGLFVDGGLTFTHGGLVVTNGVTVFLGGMRVTAGGLTITEDGLTVNDGLTINLGGFAISGGLAVDGSGLFVSDGLTIVGPSTVASVSTVSIIKNRGLKVSGGLSVQTEGFTVQNGMTVGIGGVTVNDRLDVTGGYLLKNQLRFTVHDLGAYVEDDLYTYTESYFDTTSAPWSDQRLKNNITVIDDALYKVSQLRGVYFSWKSNKQTIEDGGVIDIADNSTVSNTRSVKKHVGLIAQEVQAVLPEVTRVFDEHGHIGVSYEEMVGLLLEAIHLLDDRTKENSTQIAEECPCKEEMESHIESLWSRIEALKSRENVLRGLIEEAEKQLQR